MERVIDLTGKRFGKLTVECRVGSRGSQPAWSCACDCGRKTIVIGPSLRYGATKSCGCLLRESSRKLGRARVVDATGMRFGRLVVLGLAEHYEAGKPMWRCRCDCGNEKMVLGTRLREGTTQSCGCFRSDASRVRSRRHGMLHSPEYQAWCAMKQRCLNPRHRAYCNYGGRGIGIYPEWIVNFGAFLSEVGRKPDPALTLERLDNERGYEPGNVTWETRTHQNRNKRPRRRRAA